MSSRHILLDSPALGRRAHVWCFGDVGTPVVVFPSNAGVAHEWQQSGMIDALGESFARGGMKLYCPESNISQSFSAAGPLEARMARHRQYEHFILETLIPFIRQDCRSPDARVLATGCSMGAMYSSLFALKFPEVFRGALCLSGRYRAASFVQGGYSDELYFNDVLAFLPNLEGAALERVRQQTHLTLVVGRGPFENSCLPETLEFGTWLKRKGIPNHLAVWGTDSRHDYTWWRRQAAHYLPQLS
ncbi:MAG: alpha/beta hydrolase-fold protein [Archangium sp.]|nr:alpha/beta hydrolase-fold protein [Archangium sp.]